MKVITIASRVLRYLETSEDESLCDRLRGIQDQLEDIQKLPPETIVRNYPFIPVPTCDECEKVQKKTIRISDHVDHPYGDYIDVCAECLKLALSELEGE